MGSDRAGVLVHIYAGVWGYLPYWSVCKGMKTIKEIAAECGVSEQAVRAWCRRNQDAKGSFAINESIKTAIYQHYLGVGRNEVSQPAKASSETSSPSEMALISMLQNELERKNEQLAVKDRQIEELNARLAESNAALVAAQQTAQAAQALHAGTIQRQMLEEGGSPADTQEPEQREKMKWWERLFRG